MKSPDGPAVRLTYMPQWLGIILFAVGYFALMRWVLPKFGVPT
jgi:hypothetical protein